MKNELKQRVIEEAVKLKEHATKEELERLDFAKLKPLHSGWCVYGQLAGDCHNERAKDLLSLCAKPYTADAAIFLETGRTEFVAGERRYAFSAIEFYINQDNAQNATLISFLRGEREGLTIDEL